MNRRRGEETREVGGVGTYRPGRKSNNNQRLRRVGPEPEKLRD